MQKIKEMIIKNREELEGIAGMLILSAVAFSNGIGLLPSVMLAVASVIRVFAEIGNEKPRTLESLAVGTILLLPIANIALSRDAKYLLALIGFVLIVVSVIRKNNETNERY